MAQKTIYTNREFTHKATDTDYARLSLSCAISKLSGVFHCIQESCGALYDKACSLENTIGLAKESIDNKDADNEHKDHAVNEEFLTGIHYQIGKIAHELRRVCNHVGELSTILKILRNVSDSLDYTSNTATAG